MMNLQRNEFLGGGTPLLKENSKMSKALIIDDVAINRDLLEEILEVNYEVLQAENGRIGLELLDQNKDDLEVILLDFYMPELDGEGFLKGMKERGLIGRIPVLMISTEESAEIQSKCFDLGVSDFIVKPFNFSVVERRVENTASLFKYKNNLESIVDAQTEQLRDQNERLININESIIESLGSIVEARNLESGEHVRRVKLYTEIVAHAIMDMYPEYGLTALDIDRIAYCSPLHDVGKIMISDAILTKPGKFTDEEFEYMKSHTVFGCEVLDRVDGIWTLPSYKEEAYKICRYHHERFDGKGYPDKLVGDNIPIGAQIVALADVYDALVHDRVYKKAFPKDVAFSMIVEGKCGLFNPKILKVLEKVKAQMEAVD